MASQMDPLEEPRAKLKVCLAGEAFVGKTSLIRRFVYDEFEDKYITTLGTKVTKKDLRLDVDGSNEERIVLMVWDIMGNRGIRDLLQDAYFNRAHGALLVCDVTRAETLPELALWRESIRSVAGDIPAFILANKADLKEEAQLGKKELKAFAKESGAPFLLTSAKTGKNVEEAFEALARMGLEGKQGRPD